MKPANSRKLDYRLNDRLPDDESRQLEFKEIKGGTSDDSISEEAWKYAVGSLKNEGGMTLNLSFKKGYKPWRIRADKGNFIFHQRLGFTCEVNAGFAENRRPCLTYSEIPLSASCSNCGM